MKLTRLFAIALVALGVSLAAPSAHAVTFTFADPGSILPAASVGCFNGDDRCGATLTWTLGPISVTASGLGAPGSTKGIIQDRNPDHGGLGVVNMSGSTFSGDDEVNSGETLVLTFNQAVTLNAVTFFNEDHNPLAPGRTFDFAVGSPVFGSHLFTAPFGNTGTSFYFKFGGGAATQEDFYVASVNVDVAPIPEPGTLLLLGSGITGLAMRRRRNRK